MADRRYLIVDKRTRSNRVEGTVDEVSSVVRSWFEKPPFEVELVLKHFFDTLGREQDASHEATYLQLDYYRMKD